MTAFFSDSFSGTGSVAGHSPNTPYGSETWVTGTYANPVLNLNSGELVSASSGLSNFGEAWYGVLSTNYGNPSDIVLSFSFTTGSDISSTATPHQGFSIGVQCGESDIALELQGADPLGDYPNNPIVWSLNLVGGSGASVDVTSSLSANTTYSGTYTVTDGLQTLYFLGQTLFTDAVYTTPATGLSQIYLLIGTGNSIGPMSASLFVPAATNLIAPSPTLVAEATAVVERGIVNLTAPRPTTYGTAHQSYGENALIVSAPSPTLVALGGANAALTAPSPTISITSTSVIFGGSALSAPSPNVSASGRTSAMANMALMAPGPNVKAYGGAVVSVTIGAPTVTSTGTAGAVGRAALTVPMFQLSASGSEQNHGSANLVVPMPRLAATIQAYMTIPMATLTAIGTATVTATYEAYALNLKHTDPEANDELTRYTNFPFTHVVRYKDSYYGVSAGALYLLEGTTDNTVPIPFDVKTATTDFDAPELKTVRYAYFGGRMGSASTVSISAGETTPVSYSYTTPRGTLAQNYRQPFGRGLKARYFSFGVSGSEELQIDTIDLDVLTLKRRI